LTPYTDTLLLTGQNLTRVFNFKHWRFSIPQFFCITPKQPNLKVKTWPRYAPVSYHAPAPLSVEDGVALGDEGSTAIAPVPPQVVGLSPVGSSPGLHLHRRQHEHDGLASFPGKLFSLTPEQNKLERLWVANLSSPV
jgi:hypothetical protein